MFDRFKTVTIPSSDRVTWTFTSGGNGKKFCESHYNLFGRQ